MKKIILILAIVLLIPFAAISHIPISAKKYILPEAFTINDGRIVWQKVYEYDCSISELETSMIKLKYIKLISKTESVYKFDFIISELKDLFFISKNKYGYLGNIIDTGSNMLLWTRPFVAEIVLEIKDLKYRVTVSNLRILKNGIDDSRINDEKPIEYNVLNANNKTRYHEFFDAMNYFLTNYFVYKQSDNW